MTLSDQEFYELCKPIIHGIVGKRVFEHKDRDDIAQEAWMKCWKNWRKIQQEGHTYNDEVKYLKGVARNSTNWVIHVYLEMRLTEVPYNPVLFAEVDRKIEGYLDEVTLSTSYGYLYQAIERLSNGQRDALARVFWEGDSISSLGGNQRSYYRAIDKLGRMLNGEVVRTHTQGNRVYRESLWYDVSSANELDGAIPE